jgi:hypothetical protein
MPADFFAQLAQQLKIDKSPVDRRLNESSRW